VKGAPSLPGRRARAPSLRFAGAVANEAGGERTRGLLNRPGPCSGLRALLPHRAVPLSAAARQRREADARGKTRRQRPPFRGDMEGSWSEAFGKLARFGRRG